MAVTHLLVDLENVQPEPDDVRAWLEKSGPVWIFHAANQKKLLPPLEVLGDHVTLVPTSGSGKNALDFHLVFYLGYLASRNGGSRFVVLSKDKGYDPAIEHARILDLDVTRRQTLGKRRQGTPAKKPAPAKKATQPKTLATKKKAASANKSASKPKVVAAVKPVADPYERFVEILRVRPKNRPGKRDALERHLKAFLGGSAAPTAYQDIVARLLHHRLLRFNGEKVEYNIS